MYTKAIEKKIEILKIRLKKKIADINNNRKKLI